MLMLGWMLCTGIGFYVERRNQVPAGFRFHFGHGGSWGIIVSNTLFRVTERLCWDLFATQKHLDIFAKTGGGGGHPKLLAKEHSF